MGLTVLVGAYAWFGLVITSVVMLGVVAAVVLFERDRARAIVRDLRERPARDREQG
jgi:hypothetical protein